MGFGVTVIFVKFENPIGQDFASTCVMLKNHILGCRLHLVPILCNVSNLRSQIHLSLGLEP